jgi:hypothetical protein
MSRFMALVSNANVQVRQGLPVSGSASQPPSVHESHRTPGLRMPPRPVRVMRSARLGL